MQTGLISISSVYRNLTITVAHLIVLSGLVLPLVGCGADGSGGPVISSLSTPTDSQSSATNPTAEGDATASRTSVATAATANESENPDLVAALPDQPGEENPAVAVTSTPSGATARLTWDATADPNVVGYTVYYGKKSSREHGSCSYEESQSVEAPPATIAGLEPNTPYFFAISAYGGESESLCSNEVLVVTPSVQS
jgi:Fibronectin type III domain